MPIRFHCSNCQQRLSVASRKAAQEVKCPRCRRIVRVPDRDDASTMDASESPAPQPISSFPELATDGELVYVADDAPQGTAPGSTAQTVAVPRYVLYMQGFLLGAVALVFFVFGLAVGSRSRTSPGPARPGPACSVSGTVLYAETGQARQPDAGAVVILLPVARRPDEKGAAEGLGPDAPIPADDHPALAMVRSLGGDYARVDRRGRYRARAAGGGHYFLLVVSKHVQRRSEEQPKATELAQMGRYFVPASRLLGGQRYQWRQILLREDREIDVSF